MEHLEQNIGLRLTVIPAVYSYEDDILVGLQFSNDLVLPVPDGGHQVILEHQLLSQLLHDVLEQPKVDREFTLTEMRLVRWDSVTHCLSPTSRNLFC